MSGDDNDRVYLAAGDVIANKYRVDRILGVGGVGFVVAATHVDLGGLFALKFLHRRFVADKTICERFTREAKAACQISSEYVARAYDVGSHDGAPFIVLEHLVGRDLSSMLAERGALGLRETVEYGLQACAALAVAHANGIVHRDIKPENLFVVDEHGVPTLKLLDFGISKFVLAAERATNDSPWQEESITGTLTCGTPDYMSPEQIRSTVSVDARSDIWSLGMVLYELIASKPAFQAESIADTCAAVLETEPRRLDSIHPELPPGFADVVARCLQKDPDQRFATIAELGIALLPFASPRALGVAENSEWIRRAAIRTIGSGTDPLLSSSAPTFSARAQASFPSTPAPSIRPPASSSSAPASSRSATVISVHRSNFPPDAVGASPFAAPARRRRWLVAVTALTLSIAGIGAYAWIGGSRAAGRGLPARVATDSPLPGPVPTAASPINEPAASQAPLPGATVPGSSAAAIRIATPSTTRAMTTPVRGPASFKTASSPPNPPTAAPSIPPSSPSPVAQPSPWQIVTAPPAHTARSIDSSNPWSTSK
jgi:eukaryotic-like serine/threonine-protein kinase